MKKFLCKIMPPRPTFSNTMSERERRIMQEHATYWTGAVNEGKAIVFGLVADPEGDWGLAIVQAQDRDEADNICVNDPAFKADIEFDFRLFLMPLGATTKDSREISP
jgi:hypothetical protein